MCNHFYFILFFVVYSVSAGELIFVKNTEVPRFSITGGFYSSPQLLTLSVDAADTEIYYTNDGSEPTRDKTKYNGVIKLDKTQPVRARVYSTGNDSSYVITHTYFIGERIPELPVVSIVTDSLFLFDKDTGIYVGGANAASGMRPPGGMPPPGILDSMHREGQGRKHFGGEMPPFDRERPPMNRPMREDRHMGSRPEGGPPPGMGRNSDGPRPNYEQDWKRKANFEFYDTDQDQQINKEVDIAISGNISRHYELKSLKVTGNKLYGNPKFEYSFFDDKPFLSTKSILLRNSGQDFQGTMMRDGMIQTLVNGHIDIDCQSYQPAVVFINGIYYGMENIRERNNRFFVQSNRGLKKDDFYFVETPHKGSVELEGSEESVAAFNELISYVRKNDMADDIYYDEISQRIDIEEFINYTLLEVYAENTGDWPDNNYKAYCPKEDGKWRWIAHDFDFGFSRSESNSFDRLLNGRRDYKHCILMRELLKNDSFKKELADRFAVQLGSVYSPETVIKVIDSIAGFVRNEFDWHAKRWNINNQFDRYIASFKEFGMKRADVCYNQLRELLDLGELVSFQCSATDMEAELTFNGIKVPGNRFDGQYFTGENVTVKVTVPENSVFKGWLTENGEVYSLETEIQPDISKTASLIASFGK